MTVAYCRSDITTIRIPATAGGCGAEHVKSGKVFQLDCEQCAPVVLGHNRPKVWKWKEGRGYQQGQLDNWPEWSPTVQDIPLTPDEEFERERLKTKGTRELETMNALTQAKLLGLDVSDAMQAALGGVREFEALKAEPQVICAAGHSNRVGARYCDACGASMQVTRHDTEDGEANAA